MIEAKKTVEQYLKEKGEYVATTVGISMYPLLKHKQYAVKIAAVNGRLKKYDVALFRRGQQLVLHRVIKVYPDRYFIRGDNCDGGEYVSDSQIIGALTEIKGKDKLIKVTDFSYLVYSRLTVFRYLFRRTKKKLSAFAHRWAKKIKRNLRK